MRETPIERPSLFFRIVIGLAAAGWLYAFLPPMGQLGLLQGASTILPVLLFLVIGQMFPWILMRGTLALVGVFFYVLKWWSQGPTLGSRLQYLWLQELHEVSSSIHTMTLREPLQTTLFLVVLCMVYWLVVYAALRPKLWAFYNVLAVLVLGIVDGNTQVHPNTAIVVQLLLFVGLLGIVQFRRLSAQLVYRGRPVARFFLPLALLLVMAAGIGFAVPKPGPVWADPFARFDNSTGGVGPALKTIGYQMDNTRLGGSFVPNHTPVLAVIESDPAYLRGAVYSQYTGHGWLQGAKNSLPVDVGQAVPKADLQFNPGSGVPTKSLTQEIYVLNNQLKVPVLFSAFSPEKLVSDASPTKGNGVTMDTNTGVLNGPNLSAGEVYKVQSLEMEPPDATLSALPALPANHAQAFPQDIAHDYLQLPASMPSDVQQLTQSLTTGMTSEYDIVLTVQNFLKLNYTYATTGIPVPGPRQDYVSQFLFDSKKGYCNNFSSSMAVMLRTIGIPTRWVTGFTEGTMDPEYNGKGQRFVITNADAHSWVEVYFPNVGWVPFDPTPQFDMTFAIPDSTATATPVTPPKTPVRPPTPPVTPPTTSASSSAGGFHIPWMAVLRVMGYAALVILVLGLAAAFFFRHALQDWRYRSKWNSDTPEGLKKGVLQLVRLLTRVGDVRKSTPTVRDLHSAAKSYGIEEPEFREFVQTFEGYAYGGIQPDKSQIHRIRKTWTRWILEILHRGR